MQQITAERVLEALADIAFDAGGDTKTADRLRALEMLYRHLHLGDNAGPDPAVIVEDIGEERRKEP